MPFMQIRAWYYKRVFALQVRYYLPDYTESTIGIVWQCQLCTPGLVLPARLHRIHNWHCLAMPIVQVLDNPWCYTDCIFGIVWQCQLCTLVPVLPAGLHRIHNWHCLTMPIVQVLDNPLPQSVRQCQLCRQCLLCRGPTMPFVQTMPIMRLGHSVPKVKLSSCQFPLFAYLALFMALCRFKISCMWFDF